MIDKTEIEQVREALYLMHSDHPFNVFSDEEIETWARLVEPYMGDIEKTLQEKLERLDNGQQKKIKNYIMTGEHCPKCGDKMILNYKFHECGECNYIHCSAEVFNMLPPAQKQGDK